MILESCKVGIDMGVLSSILSLDKVKGIALESIVLTWCTHQIPEINIALLNMHYWLLTLHIFFQKLDVSLSCFTSL